MFAHGILSCGPECVCMCMCSLPPPLGAYTMYTHIYVHTYVHIRWCMHTAAARVSMYVVVEYIARIAAEDARYFAPHVYRYHLEARYETIFAECLLSQQTTFVPFLDATGCKNCPGRLLSSRLAVIKAI